MSTTSPSHWGLAAYPVSADFRAKVEERLGIRLAITVLSEMREAGFPTMLRRLVRIRGEAGYILLEDPASTPLLPVLRLLLSLTRCRRLAVLGPDGAVLSFGRAAGFLELGRLISGTIRGAVAAMICGIELVALAWRNSRKVPLQCLRQVGYLKTNLWFGVRAGGSVGHVAGVVNALSRRCERVDLLAIERPPLLDASVTFHPIPITRAFGYPYELNYYVYQRHFVREGREVLAKARPDFLYHRLSLANYAGVRIARDLQLPLVVEYNGSEVWVSKHWGRPLRFPWLARLAEAVELRHADLVVTVSEVLGQELVDRGIPLDRVLVHPNCVDPDRFDPDRFSAEERKSLLARYRISPSAVVCGFIGTFGVWHGITLVAEAIRDLVEQNEPWLREWNLHFLLVGDGLLMPKVREILGPPRIAPYVTLTGLVGQHEAPRYLAAADVLLSPHVPNVDGSRFFGSPTKLFEYMAMGKGIVASDLDQIGEVLRHSYRASDLPRSPCTQDEDRRAILITPGSRDELIAGLRFLVERPDYRQALGRNARHEVLARYTWERYVAALLHRLEGLQA